MIPHSRSNKKILDKFDAITKDVKALSDILSSSAYLVSKDNIVLDLASIFGGKFRIVTDNEEIDKYIGSMLTPDMHNTIEGCTFVVIDLKNNKGVSEHYHDFDETVFIVSGEISVTMDNKKYKAGDIVHVPMFTVHKFKPLSEGVVLIAMNIQ